MLRFVVVKTECYSESVDRLIVNILLLLDVNCGRTIKINWTIFEQLHHWCRCIDVSICRSLLYWYRFVIVPKSVVCENAGEQSRHPRHTPTHSCAPPVNNQKSILILFYVVCVEIAECRYIFNDTAQRMWGIYVCVCNLPESSNQTRYVSISRKNPHKKMNRKSSNIILLLQKNNIAAFQVFMFAHSRTTLSTAERHEATRGMQHIRINIQYIHMIRLHLLIKKNRTKAVKGKRSCVKRSSYWEFSNNNRCLARSQTTIQYIVIVRTKADAWIYEPKRFVGHVPVLVSI